MKKALVIALILLVIGTILVGIGWALLQKYPIKEGTVKDVSYVYHISEAPQKINIITTASRVELLPIEGDEWRVECKEAEKTPHTIELIDGVLTIKQTESIKNWYEHIGIFTSFQDLRVIVYLPAGIYESLDIDSTSGSIKVQEGFTFTTAKLYNTSGSVLCASNVVDVLDVKNTSGSITVSGSVGKDLYIKNTSGSITVNGGVNGKLDVTNGSAGITIQDATPTSVTIKNTSGGIDLINVVCSGNCKIENGSSSIELENCDAASFDLKTVSGGIRASILSGKTYDCHSTSGGVHVPENTEGGTFKAKTTSGGIRVEVVS